jgi:hypothetical protein
VTGRKTESTEPKGEEKVDVEEEEGWCKKDKLVGTILVTRSG